MNGNELRVLQILESWSGHRNYLSTLGPLAVDYIEPRSNSRTEVLIRTGSPTLPRSGSTSILQSVQQMSRAS